LRHRLIDIRRAELLDIALAYVTDTQSDTLPDLPFHGGIVLNAVRCDCAIETVRTRVGRDRTRAGKRIAHGESRHGSGRLLIRAHDDKREVVDGTRHRDREHIVIKADSGTKDSLVAEVVCQTTTWRAVVRLLPYV